MAQDYVYEVARIRVKEPQLLTRPQLQQLMAAPDYQAALAQLSDWGWGSQDGAGAEKMLAEETAKTWALADELMGDGDTLSVLKLTKDYQNLKAAIKQVYTDSKLPPERLYVEGGCLPAARILEAVREQDYEKLPEAMAETARAAAALLSETGDGMKCDARIDRDALAALSKAAGEAKETALKDYADLTIAAANVRIALRAAAGGSDLESIKEMLAPESGLDASRLAAAALDGREAVAEYLKFTQYAPLGEALLISMRRFETACDDLLIEKMKEQKNESFTLGPLVAYIVARENEIKCVRMLLTAKLNGLPASVMQESLRETYV